MPRVHRWSQNYARNKDTKSKGGFANLWREIITLTTKDTLQEAYATAVERNLAKSLETSDDWARYNALVATRTERLETERRDYNRNYLTRLAEAEQAIMREEHGKDYDQPLPEGVSRQSSASQLTRKADTRVRLDHEQRIAVIHEDHRNALSELGNEIAERRDQARAQEHTRDHAQDRRLEQRGDLEREWNAAVVRSGPRRT